MKIVNLIVMTFAISFGGSVSVNAAVDEQKQKADYEAELGAYVTELNEANRVYSDKWRICNQNPDSMALYHGRVESAERAFERAKMKFIEAHPSYSVSARYVADMIDNPYSRFTVSADRMRELACMVSVCPDTAEVNRVNRALESGVRYAYMMEFPDFDVTDINGDTVSFTRFITPGSYTLVDVWASWCGACRKAFPTVHKLKEMYGDRLQVLPLSMDLEHDPWVKAIKEDGLEGVMLRTGSQSQQDKIMELLDIKAIPRLMLLDDHNRILYSTPRPDLLYKAVQRIMDAVGKDSALMLRK